MQAMTYHFMLLIYTERGKLTVYCRHWVYGKDINKSVSILEVSSYHISIHRIPGHQKFQF